MHRDERRNSRDATQNITVTLHRDVIPFRPFLNL